MTWIESGYNKIGYYKGYKLQRATFRDPEYSEYMATRGNEKDFQEVIFGNTLERLKHNIDTKDAYFGKGR